MREKRRYRLLGTCVGSAAVLLTCGTGLAGSLGRAMADGDWIFDLRYRYEKVDQETFTDDAKASTARLRLGYETGAYHGFSALLEFEAVRVVGGEQYNSTANGKTRYPVVADPEDEELNRLWLGYTAPRDTLLKFGRQRINLGNQRFVGAVGWRQNEQTFDAFSITSKPSKSFSLFAGHLNNANRISGENHPNPALADLDLNADLLSVTYQAKSAKVTGYGHLMELEDTPAASHKNFGLRFDGEYEFAQDLRLLYVAEWADQSDYKNAPSTVDASYGLAELGLTIGETTFKASYELLEGDGTYAFQTPLATLHAFNGWTDRFLVTPATGLEDLYFTVSTKASDFKLTGVYHEFSADTGGADYGTELGFLATKTYGSFSWLVKFAEYDADFVAPDPQPPYALDTEILWVALQFKH